ncbi:GntR family transcriptional regulator [Rhodococcus gannanensis]|uniref:GntR family transcriptional regulator n=1 Tax=Rhodococcus gannanensis TaxID=1960308 RepID=A0ABW4NYX9_9NOCA
MGVPGEPAYRLLANRLRGELADGVYSGGVRLPTEAELAVEHGVSRQTVRRAFHDLVAEGIVHRVPGRGTFASEATGRYLRQLGSIEDLMNLSADTTMEIVTPPRRQVDIEAASRLRLDIDVLYTVSFRRLHDAVPFVYTTVYLPETIGKAVADAPELAAGASSTHTMIGLIEPHLAMPIVQADQSITVAPAPEAAASAVGCEPGHPMLRVDRLYSNELDEPTELAISYFLPEHYTYRVTLRRR